MQFLCGDFLLPCHDEDFEAIVAEIDADANMLVGGMVQFHSGVLQKYIQKLHKVPRHELSKWVNSCEDYAGWTQRKACAARANDANYPVFRPAPAQGAESIVTF